jgi:SAM-dependent methyltransferase
MNSPIPKEGPEFQKRTRDVFHKIHIEQLEVSGQKSRTLSLTTRKFLGVDDGFFSGKVCLEAGCGSWAPATQNMLAGGAAKVHAVDLSATIFEKIPQILAGHEGRYELAVGSVLDLQFGDATFDFAICDGVLHNTGDVARGIRELCRVVKPGGGLYISTRGEGGLMSEIEGLIRNHYENDPEWRRLIDELDAKDFEKVFDWISAEMARNGDDFGTKVSLELFRAMFDADLVLTIKDRIQAPVYEAITEAEVVRIMSEHGFINFARPVSYIKYDNVRRFLAPFYYDYANKISKMLYGEGYLQIRAEKRAA